RLLSQPHFLHHANPKHDLSSDDEPEDDAKPPLDRFVMKHPHPGIGAQTAADQGQAVQDPFRNAPTRPPRLGLVEAVVNEGDEVDAQQPGAQSLIPGPPTTEEVPQPERPEGGQRQGNAERIQNRTGVLAATGLRHDRALTGPNRDPAPGDSPTQFAGSGSA